MNKYGGRNNVEEIQKKKNVECIHTHGKRLHDAHAHSKRADAGAVHKEAP